MDIKDLDQAFRNMGLAWQRGPTRSFALQVVTDLLVRGNISSKFDSAVCVGLGSIEEHYYAFTNQDGAHYHSYRSWRQLMLLLDIVELLQHLSTPKPAPPIQVYVHEPELTSLDNRFLSLLKINVVDEERARSLITPHSFLFAPFLGWRTLLQRYLPGKDPVLLVSNDLQALSKAHLKALAATDISETGLGTTEHHAQAMLMVRDVFLQGRKAAPLDKKAKLSEDDVPGIVGLVAFARQGGVVPAVDHSTLLL